jgi:hypothetical protein
MRENFLVVTGSKRESNTIEEYIRSIDSRATRVAHCGSGRPIITYDNGDKVFIVSVENEFDLERLRGIGFSRANVTSNVKESLYAALKVCLLPALKDRGGILSFGSGEKV